MTPAQLSHLAFVRRHVPEPYYFPNDEVRFLWPESEACDSKYPDTQYSLGFEVSKVDRLKKIHVVEAGVYYVAWSYDGKTPLFPEPVEQVL